MKPPYLKPVAAAVLMRLAHVDGPVTTMEIGRGSGLYPNGNPQTWAELGTSLVYPLAQLGLAAKCGRKPPRYEITERGRIALAFFRVIESRKLRRAGCDSVS